MARECYKLEEWRRGEKKQFFQQRTTITSKEVAILVSCNRKSHTGCRLFKYSLTPNLNVD